MQAVMSKDKFIRKMMSDMAVKRRNKIRAIKNREAGFWGHVWDTHYQIEKAIRRRGKN